VVTAIDLFIVKLIASSRPSTSLCSPTSLSQPDGVVLLATAQRNLSHSRQTASTHPLPAQAEGTDSACFTNPIPPILSSCTSWLQAPVTLSAPRPPTSGRPGRWGPGRHCLGAGGTNRCAPRQFPLAASRRGEQGAARVSGSSLLHLADGRVRGNAGDEEADGPTGTFVSFVLDLQDGRCMIGYCTANISDWSWTWGPFYAPTNLSCIIRKHSKFQAS
jgi:hypothetical protein